MGFFKRLLGDAADEFKKNLENARKEMSINLEEMRRNAMAGFTNSSSNSRDNDEEDDEEPQILLGDFHDGVLTIREGITELDDESLEHCKRIRKIIFPASLESLDSNVIDEQDQLEELDFSKVTKLKAIPDDFISGENKIRKLIIPNGVTEVGDGFLGEAKSGAEIFVPASVRKLGYITGNSDNDMTVYLFAANIDISDVEEDVKTLYVLPQYYGWYAKALKECDSEVRLREMPTDRLDSYGHQVAASSAIPKQEPIENNGLFSARLEAMISAALQDGVLTDKERELLKSRVEKEGEDWDEVEMIIEARLAEMQPSIPKSNTETLVEQKVISEIKEKEELSDDEEATDGDEYIVGMPYSEKTSAIVNQESNDDIDGEGYYIQNGKRIIIPTSTKVIKEQKFAEKENIEKVVFPSSIIKIESSAFSDCSHLIDIDFSKCQKLKEIGEFAFQNCALRSVDLSRCTSLETIGEFAFYGCRRLTNIVFPNSVTSIGYCAFCQNEKLSQIDLSSTNIKVLNELFGNKGLSGMKNLKHISYPASIQEVPEKMCYRLEMLESVDLSKCTQLKRICESAFACTPNLKEVLLPDSIEAMEKWAFGECGNIKHIDMPASLKEMGYGVFIGSEVENVDFSRVTNLILIPEATFAKCKKLKNVILPASLKEFGVQVFEESNIESVDFSRVTQLNTLPTLTFNECRYLKSINLPDCIKVIDKGIFILCERLKTIIMPASLTEIGMGFFEGEDTMLKTLDFSKVSSLEVIPEEFIVCDSIKTLTIPNGVKEIEDEAFSVPNLEKMFLPPSLEHFGTFGHYDMNLYCFAPQLDELEPLVDSLEKDQQLILYVLPQHLDVYIEKRDAEGVSENNLSILPMPDEYLYYYDN